MFNITIQLPESSFTVCCRNLSHLPDHLPHDCGARRGGLCIPSPPVGSWHGHHLLCHVDQNQPHLPHLWAREEVCDPTQIHQPYLPAHHHLYPHLCPGEKMVSILLPDTIPSHDSGSFFVRIRSLECLYGLLSSLLTPLSTTRNSAHQTPTLREASLSVTCLTCH